MMTSTTWEVVRVEMVYWADDEYFKFLHQQIKELHMERSQGFIISVYRALMGNRHKTRRRKVTGIPPNTSDHGVTLTSNPD